MVALQLIVVHLAAAFALYITSVPGGVTVAFSLSTLTAPWVWSSPLDLLGASLVSAALLAGVVACSACAPLACYRSCRVGPLGWGLASAFSLVGLWALIKVVVSPESGGCFWGAAVLAFFAATIEAFAAERVLGAVPRWALAIAAKRFDLPLLSDSDESRAADAAGEVGEGAAAAKKAKGGGAASLWRLVALSRPDAGFLAGGFAALIVAAVASTFTPGLVGSGIDALAGDEALFYPILWELLAVSFISGVFTGLRGWAFTVAISRLKVRLRDKLFRAILCQEQSFFDATSTGELTSRMSSDTTAVGDSVALNANVFLRSMIMALGSLAFMFVLSWRLTLLAFTIIPPTILM